MNPAVTSHSSGSGSPDDAATALRGASLAFQRSPAGGTASPDDTARQSRSAAAGTTGNRATPAHLHLHHADSSAYPMGVVAARLHQLSGPSAQLHPSSAPRFDPKSPSFIAATLAASRSVSPSPLARTPRRKISFGAASVLGNADAVDSESIAPTGNLISMFEKTKGHEGAASIRPRRASPEGLENMPHERIRAPSPKPKKRSPRPPSPPQGVDDRRSSSVPSKQPPTPPLRSSEKISAMPMPKPKLPPHLTASSNQQAKPARPQPEQLGQRIAKPAPKPAKARPPSPPSVVSTSTAELLSPKPLRFVNPTLAPPDLSSPPRGSSSGISGHSSPSPDPEKRGQISTSLRPPTPPKPRGSHKLVSSQPGGRSRIRTNSRSPLANSSLSVTPLTEFGLPIVSPSPPQQVPARHIRRGNTPPPAPVGRESVASEPSSPVRDAVRRHRPTNSSVSNLALDPLTSAIMASALASSRLTPHNTGTSLPPSLPKRQKSPRLLQTLRQPQSYSDEDPERLKIAHRHKLSSNKHAHHEGSRKRWRDQITQRERKRYEAVWASNRGYLLVDGNPSQLVDDSSSLSECVANVVVRELWKRSRLPGDELMEVWELVDRGNVGMLTRSEFIVGMWLIDQRLKGRKLPVRVSDSVWGSANGVRISRPKHK